MAAALLSYEGNGIYAVAFRTLSMTYAGTFMDNDSGIGLQPRKPDLWAVTRCFKMTDALVKGAMASLEA